MQRPFLVSMLLAGGLALGGVTFFAPATASAGGFTKVTPSTLKFEGIRYWRKKASEAKLGSVGEKMTPAAGKNYFQKKQDAPDGIFGVTIDARTTISSQNANEWGVSAGVSNVQGGVKHSGNYSGTITAYKMHIDLGNRQGNLRYETNRHIKHLNALKDEGNGGRLISAVWVLIAGDENKSECYSGDLTVTNGVWKVSTSASGCSSNSWTIEPGSIIAYEMVKVDKWNNEEITSKPTCPDNYPTYETRSSLTTPMDRCKKITYDYVAVECKLLITDKAENWYVASRDGRDVCKSRKGKDDKEVKCSKSSYDYVVQSGKDTCRKAEESYADPVCPSGYDYDKKSTSNNGVDQCELRGIESLKPDSQDGF
ncbi:MAG: hypothetical protein R3B09_32560 [Nannocystaceae bacterium]